MHKNIKLQYPWFK